MKHCSFVIICVFLIHNFRVCHNQMTTGSMRGTTQSFIGSSLPQQRSQKLTTGDDNRKPIFKYCETYEPSVEEEQLPGAYVLMVKAEDDDPPNAGGTVTYKIVKRDGERGYFTINNATGEIRTQVAFDRDEPNRQKEIYITVQATDNGRPKLSDICAFKVTITDINDNSPTFDAQEFNAQVAEDLKVDSEVMRILAYDVDDGENSRLNYSFSDNSGQFAEYFRIDTATGVVYLKQSLVSKRDTKFVNTVIVSDNGKPPKSSEQTAVSILVVSYDKQPPQITHISKEELVLDENFNSFSEHLVTIDARSGIHDEEVAFTLVKGKTIQTNSDQTFVLTPSETNNKSAYITLVRPLDYETVMEYTLTVKVNNKDNMDVSINIPVKVRDVNDETPTFVEHIRGSVVENNEPGAQAMVVKAIDKDISPAHNKVSYELVTHNDIFEIDSQTGAIRSKVPFDRENINIYNVQVKAYDNSPSAIRNDGKPNSVIQTFQITIEDKNDNAPKFSQSIYYVHNISETADKNSLIVELKANDQDTASLITYSIIDGNIDDAFYIEATTGRIKVNNKLDFEKIEKYTLTVQANDGLYEDNATVVIYILNENDEPPVFEPHNKTIEIEEERLIDDCIITLKAYDPDIKDRDAPQNIVFDIDKEITFLSVSNDGCVRLTKALDRDKPYGSPTRQVYIHALDNRGSNNALRKSTELLIVLIDINDNAPFLNVTEIVWYENEDPGEIGKLSADDYDSPENGPPFYFRFPISISNDILTKFEIIGDSLYAKVTFDREEKKFYDIDISITDSGIIPLTGTSTLRVIIGDKNDNPAQDGESEIFVYKYEDLDIDIAIGRVYVQDPDDWDLPDKVFTQQNMHDYFHLSEEDRGMMVMFRNTPEGSYILNFEVTEENSPIIERHTVHAIVNVTVKGIVREAVMKSGSVRILGSSITEFIEKSDHTGLSKKDVLQQYLAKIVNTTLNNVDVFTVLQSPSNSSLVDVRFSAHGSPYYASERLNNIVTEYQDRLESDLQVEFVMISISECINETVCPLGVSCSNKLSIKDEPAVVFSNKTSFVGVKAVVEAVCDCLPRQIDECFNGGYFDETKNTCVCTSGFEGPNCEILGVSFNGDGWAMYPTFDACNKTDITLSVLANTENGLIFYAGPLTPRQAQLTKDFISLELKDGLPLLRINYGNTTEEIRVPSSKSNKLTDGAAHKLRITYGYEDVQIEIDDCKSKCIVWHTLSEKGLLNVNGPLQMGGLRYPFDEENSKIIWGDAPPTDVGFAGCIRNFTYNDLLYNLGQPSDQYHSYADCNMNGIVQAVTFGIDTNFLIAILVCIAVLLILLLAVVYQRRQHDSLNEKDIDDTRENIINYEDEGGGECDTNYDLSVFQTNLDEKPILKDSGDVPADISCFLDTKKDSCDKDPDNLPYDDVRHYAYEGDGNSTGSLSSLASCTDDGDLNFSYLPRFGPRFRKLADMYGEYPSDEETQESESLC